MARRHEAARRRGTARHTAANPLASIGGQIPLPIPVPDWSKPIILALLLLAIWLAVRWALAGRRARRLEGQRITLERDLDAMQKALVPDVPASLEGLAISVAYRPAEGPAAGGDFYDLFSPAPGRAAIIVGDVAGHGHQALTQAALTRYTLRAYLQAGLEPRRAIALAGEVLVDRSGGRFATVAVALFDRARGTLTYALAGHPPPLVRGLDRHAAVTACSSPPIGWGLPTGRRQTTIGLRPGASVCFFSDGLIEAHSEGKRFGRERLGQALAELGARANARRLLEHVRAANHTNPDDMVACILAPDGAAAASAAGRLEELEVDAAELEQDHVVRFLEQCRVPSGKIGPLIERAREIAEGGATALLRAQLSESGTTATLAGGPEGADEISAGASAPAAQPLLRS